jgi:hypothetical protein
LIGAEVIAPASLDRCLGIAAGADARGGDGHRQRRGLDLGARLATSPQARKWVFLLLVVVISAELARLAMHYIFQTHQRAD